MEYIFCDGVFSFWTAHYGSWANDKRIVFRVRIDRIPKDRAKDKSIIDYDRLLPSEDDEIEAWRQSHFNYPILENMMGSLSMKWVVS